MSSDLGDLDARIAALRAQLAALDAQGQAVPSELTEQLAALDAHNLRRRFALEAEPGTLDLFTLPEVDAPTEEELATLRAEHAAREAAWRAALEQLNAELEADRERLDALSRATVEREREDAFHDVETEITDGRTPLARAAALTDQRLTALRRALYRQVPLPWIGYTGPARITAVNTTAKLATVRLQDGSQGTVDGVEYGSGNPVVGHRTTLYQAAQAPSDPRDPRVRPVPAGRAWIVVPPGGSLWLYYAQPGRVWRTAWPPIEADQPVEVVRTDPGRIQFLLGIDGQGWLWVQWTDFSTPVTIFGGFQTYIQGWENQGAGPEHVEYPIPPPTVGGTNSAGAFVMRVDDTPGRQGFLAIQESTVGLGGQASRTTGTFLYSTTGAAWTPVNATLLLSEVVDFGGNSVTGGSTYRVNLYYSLNREHANYRLWSDPATGAPQGLWGLSDERVIERVEPSGAELHYGDLVLLDAAGGRWDLGRAIGNFGLPWALGRYEADGGLKTRVIKQHNPNGRFDQNPVWSRNDDFPGGAWSGDIKGGLRFSQMAGQDRTAQHLLVRDWQGAPLYYSLDAGATWTATAWTGNGGFGSRPAHIVQAA